MNTTAALVPRIDAAVAERAMLSHEFYVRWAEGGLSVDALRGYAGQYFAFEKAFPRYLSGVHTQLDDPAARKVVLRNLNDEEGADPSHQELWLRFAEALGVERADVLSASLLPQTQGLLDAFASAVAAGPAQGLAALYAYESQAARVARTKLDGLARWYGIEGAGAEFFTVHASMDDWHADAERDLLAGSPTDADEVLAAATSAADGLWGFLDGVLSAYC